MINITNNDVALQWLLLKEIISASTETLGKLFLHITQVMIYYY